MKKSIAIQKFRDGEITIFKDKIEGFNLLAEILSTAKPKKIISSDPMERRERLMDNFYWSAKGADVWLAAPFNNSTIQTVIKLSEIE